MSSIVLVGVLIMPIVYFLGLSPFTTELIASLGFGFGAIVTLLLLFVPKMTAVYGIGAAVTRISAKVVPDSARERHGGDGDLAAATDEEGEKCLKGKSEEERLVICQDQLRRWQGLLLDQQRGLMYSKFILSALIYTTVIAPRLLPVMGWMAR
jgi:hypothetical protein